MLVMQCLQEKTERGLPGVTAVSITAAGASEAPVSACNAFPAYGSDVTRFGALQ